MGIAESIQHTKNGFEKSFKEGTLYNKQTQSDAHIEQIIKTLQLKENDSVLDLGTGSGYLAFEIAKKNRNCRITGLDIVEQALEENRKKKLPAIEDTFKEIKRVLKDKGRLFISDPTPNSDDDERFVDDYMQMKKDGHIKYYTKDEYITLAGSIGMTLKIGF